MHGAPLLTWKRVRSGWVRSRNCSRSLRGLLLSSSPRSALAPMSSTGMCCNASHTRASRKVSAACTGILTRHGGGGGGLHARASPARPSRTRAPAASTSPAGKMTRRR